jgi:hypothetical protein
MQLAQEFLNLKLVFLRAEMRVESLVYQPRDI